MTLSSVMILLLAILSIVFGLNVAIHGIQTKRRAGFSLFMLNMALYAGGRFYDLLSDESLGVFAFGASLFLPLSLHFTFLNLFGFASQKERLRLLAADAGGAVLFAVLLTTPLKEYAAFYLAAALLALVAVGYILHLFRYHAALSNSYSRNTVHLFCLATVLFAICAILLSMPLGDGFWALMAVLLALYSYVLYIAVQKSWQVDFKSWLPRAISILAIALIINLIYSLAILWAGIPFGKWFFYALSASFVTVLCFESIRPWLESFISNLLSPELVDFKDKIANCKDKLQGINEPREFIAALSHELTALQVAEKTAFYVISDDDSHAFSLLESSGGEYPPAITEQNGAAILAKIWAQQEIINGPFLQKRAELLTIHAADDINITQELSEISQLIASMSALDATLICPLLTEDKLEGIFLIKSSRNYSSEELELWQKLMGFLSTELQKFAQAQKISTAYAKEVIIGYLQKNGLPDSPAAEPTIWQANDLLRECWPNDDGGKVKVKINEALPPVKAPRQIVSDFFVLLSKELSAALAPTLVTVDTSLVTTDNENTNISFNVKYSSINVPSENPLSLALIILAPGLVKLKKAQLAVNISKNLENSLEVSLLLKANEEAMESLI